MKRKLTGFCMAAILSLSATAADATLIWQDEFARPSGNDVGNGWIETEDDANDVAIVFNNYLLLRDNGPDGAATQQGISTQGYENISIEFRWRPWNAEANDRLTFNYRALPGLLWTTAFDTNLGGTETYRTQTVDLGTEADDIAALDINFTIDASYRHDALKIDYVRLYGSRIADGGNTSEIAEPASLALFAAALLALAWAAGRRRRRPLRSRLTA